ncbi:MAG: adenylate/guanylate cyclase domain-containing protein [Betaproteobacteria bacterium]
MERKLAAILYADAAGYSRLTEADEEGTHDVLRNHRAVLIQAIGAEAGRVCHTAGDAVLAEFGSVVAALNCAIAAQRDLAKRNGMLPENRRLKFRIGVNLGDVMVDGAQIYGNGVNIAARLEALAEPGGISISGRVLEQVEDKLDVGFAYLGPQSVKNIKKPVNAYKVLLDPADAGKIADVQKPAAFRWPWPAVAIALHNLFFGALARRQRPAHPQFERASSNQMAFPLPDKPSIAVLPFDNLSGDPDQQFLANGISEEIITTLCKVPELLVIARNSTFTYKGKPVKVQQVAEELGVQYVLEGSVQRVRERVRVSCQLIDALKGHHLWAQRYDREIKDIFALQDDIVLKIAVALQIELVEGEQARIRYATTNNIQAWERFVTSLSVYFQFTKSSIRRARALLEEAVDLDPQYAIAWSYLAWSHFMDYQLGFADNAKDSIKQAHELANRTFQLNPDLAEVHALFALLAMHNREFEEAIASAKRATDLAPGGAEVWAVLGEVLLYAGDWRGALEAFTRAMRLHRFYPSWYAIFLVRAFALAGDLEQAVRYGRDGIERASAQSSVIKGFIHGSLAFAYGTAGRMSEAKREILEGLRAFPQLSEAAYRRATFYRDPAELERLLRVLRAAGLPERPPVAASDAPSSVIMPVDKPRGG